jgi:hypothetical protein
MRRPVVLLPNARGNYHFLPGIAPYSSGVVADAGYEVRRVTLLQPVPYREGFARIEAHLREAGRPRQALCAVELRSPAPFTRAGFAEFNVGYRALLEEWELLVEGQNPIARTNVAPQWNAPAEPSLFAFSYTAPAGHPAGPTFVVAGAGELRGGPLAEALVIRPGENSTEAMGEKAAYVMAAMTRRLDGLGVGWAEVTAIDVYTVQAVEAVLGGVVLDAIGTATTRGLHWYHARPPIDELEYEMDVRGVRTELFL